MSYYVYILRCADGTLYTGTTNDVARRESVHNSGKGAKYTRSRLPVEVVYMEDCTDKPYALQREREIKKMTREQKLYLVAKLSCADSDKAPPISAKNNERNQVADMSIKLGNYIHFKGNKYEVIGTAKHSETLEEMVVYRALSGDGALWVRPLAMWDEVVEHNGKQVKRFTHEEELKA